MATFINQSKSLPSISKDTFIFDNNAEYFVAATAGDISQNTITFGNGGDDRVTATGNISQNTITFGDGNDDFVRAAGDISQNTITFGKGDNDRVNISGNSSHDTITLGDGGDQVSIFGNSSYDSITLGDGIADRVVVGGSTDHDSITLGDGNLDKVIVHFGNSSHDSITLGDGDNDSVEADGGSGHDLIIVGNGNNDQITLNVASGKATGADTIITGTGSSDTVNVAAHTNADTFGFSLGTNGTSFTKITGAQTGDQVAVGNSAGLVLTDPNGLGNTLVNEGSNSSWTSLALFIQAIAAMPGDTFMGNNGTDTFIFTDTANGQTGAIELAGVFSGANSTISNHVMTLQT